MNTIKKTAWFDRQFKFGAPSGMLPFYLERLNGTSARLRQKVNGISDKLLSEKYEDKWSVKQNIGHLTEVDEIANKRIDEMVNGISPMSPAVFEPRKDYNAIPIGELLALFDENRRKNLQRYQSLSDADLVKTSQHPRLKVMLTPVDLAYLDAEHDDHHMVRMGEIIAALS